MARGGEDGLRRAVGRRFILEHADGSRRRWLPQGFPPLASSAFSGSFHCSEARCKGSCSRYRPPSPSQVRKKPWVRGTEGLQAGGGCHSVPSVPWNHCFHFLKSKPLRRLPPTPAPTQSPSIIPRPFGGCCHGDHKQNGMQINTARTTGDAPARGVGAVGNASTQSTPGIKKRL